jgi:hypothetical protein
MVGVFAVLRGAVESDVQANDGDKPNVLVALNRKLAYPEFIGRPSPAFEVTGRNLSPRSNSQQFNYGGYYEHSFSPDSCWHSVLQRSSGVGLAVSR